MASVKDMTQVTLTILQDLDSAVAFDRARAQGELVKLQDHPVGNEIMIAHLLGKIAAFDHVAVMIARQIDVHGK